MARQRQCRGLARQRLARRLPRNGKPAASLLTPSSSEPRTPAGKARVLDARKWLRERDGLSAGGRWIRTSGSWSRDRQTVMGEVTAFSKPGADLLGNRRFESISLQQGVHCELDPTSRAREPRTRGERIAA